MDEYLMSSYHFMSYPGISINDTKLHVLLELSIHQPPPLLNQSGYTQHQCVSPPL